MGIIKSIFGFGRSSPGQGALVDKGLSRVVDCVLENCEYVVGAGQGAAETVAALAVTHSNKECLACDVSSEKCFEFQNRLVKVKNYYLHNAAPREFLRMLSTDKPYLFTRDVLVFLSVSGGGGDRRFFDEVRFVTERFEGGFLFLHGYKVPDRDDFAYESQRGRECSQLNISMTLKGLDYSLFHPDYPVRASHKRKFMGWALLGLGRNVGFEFPQGNGSGPGVRPVPKQPNG